MIGPIECRHRPTPAVKFVFDGDNALEIALWSNGKAYVTDEGQLVVRNVQGEFVVPAGDSVILGVNNELHPCPADLVDDLYEPVGEGS